MFKPAPQILPFPRQGDLPENLPQQTIDVCICTFRRPEVVRALTSVAAQVLPAGFVLHVIVADNDDTPSARDRVLATARDLTLDLTYLHAPSRNISIARNACLEAAQGDWIAFLDDDEEALPGWLMLLLDCAREQRADAVFGPALAVYPRGAPAWMVTNDFHSNIPVSRSGTVETGHSCNALIRRASLPAGLRFRPDLGQSGGEDTEFFFRLGQSGAALAICDTALVTEPVSPHRLRLAWLIERRFAEGRHYARGSGRNRIGLFLGGSAKAMACGLAAVPLVLRPDHAAFWALRGIFHAGVAFGAIRRGNRRAYGS